MCQIDWLIILEYLKVFIEILKIFISWPLVILAIFLALILNFKTAISSWITNLHLKGKIGENSFEAHPIQNTLHNNDPLRDAVEGQNDSHITTTIEEVPEELREEPNIVAILDFAKKKPAQVISDYFALNNAYQNERIFNRLYATQIGLLRFLSIEKDWRHAEDLHVFYVKYIEKGGPQEYDQGKYIAYLAEIGLLEHRIYDNKVQIRITKKGESFVIYVNNNYTNDWFQKAY